MSKNSFLLSLLLITISCNEIENRGNLKELSTFFNAKVVSYEYEDRCGGNADTTFENINVSFSNEWKDYIIVTRSNLVLFSNEVVTNKSTGISKQNFTVRHDKNDGTIVFYIVNDSTSFSIKINYKYRYVKLYKQFDNSIKVRMTNCISIAY